MYTKRVWAWALYDFANTAFSALFVTFFYPLWIKEFLGGNEFQIGMVFGLSMLLVAVVVPLIGAIADTTGRRTRILGLLTLACIVATAWVGLVKLQAALVLGFLANFCYHSCLVVYNSLLPSLVSEKEEGRVSGFGVGVGYFGTLGSLVMTYFILSKLGWASRVGVAAIFPATALFFFVFSMPLFRYVGDTPKKHSKYLRKMFVRSSKALWNTIKSLPDYRGLVPFLLSSYSYSNGSTAAIVFLYLYARESLGMGTEQFLWIFVLFAVSAAIGSFAAGRVSDWIGPKRTLVGSGVLWCLVIGLLLTPTEMIFTLSGCLGGIALGTVWTANRPMVMRLTKREKPGQFFGFNELADKFSGAFGPMIFGWLVIAYGYNAALVSVLGFFVLGLGLLWWVPAMH